MKFSCFLLIGVYSMVAWSQDHNVSMGRLSVTSNVRSAKVFVDSTEAGVTPLVNHPVTPGKHVVCVVPIHKDGYNRSWTTNAVCENVEVDSGEESRLTFTIPRSLQIVSEPYGARISYGDSIIGETPAFVSTFAEHGSVTLSKDGYENLILMFDTSTSYLYGSLRSIRLMGDDHSTLYLEKEEARSTVPIVITASSAVLTGIAAAYLKIQADNRYSDYRNTGSAERLNQVRRLDVASGIALGVSQLSLALLTYFLLSH